MLLAKASTGTAIASLTGIAAKNATLAWFGAGALATKGFGVAGGVLVLKGIVLGPVLAVAGALLAAKSEENLAKAKLHYQEANNAAEKMATIVSFLSTVEKLSAAYNDFLVQFSAKVDRLADIVDEMHLRAADQNRGIAKLIRRLFGTQFKVDYSRLAMADRRLLHAYCLSAQVLHGVLAAPMLDREGNLEQNAESILRLAQEKSQSLLGSAQS